MIPTVLIPGLACTAEMFAAQTVALSPHGPVTVASTLEGDSIAAMAAAILRDAPSRFALGGISMGGYIAMEILRQAPERVVKLALLNTSARPDTTEQIDARRLLMERVRNGELEAVLTQVTPNLLHPDHRGRRDLVDIQVRMGRDVGSEGFIRQEAAITKRIDSRPHLADIKVPTLVLVGDRDPLTPPDRSEEIAAAIPGARLVVVPDCGHASTLEQPEAVNAALVEWLSAYRLSTHRSLIVGRAT